MYVHRLLVASKKGKASDVMEHVKVHSIHLRAEICLIFTARRPSDHISQPVTQGVKQIQAVLISKVKVVKLLHYSGQNQSCLQTRSQGSRQAGEKDNTFRAYYPIRLLMLLLFHTTVCAEMQCKLFYSLC